MNTAMLMKISNTYMYILHCLFVLWDHNRDHNFIQYYSNFNQPQERAVGLIFCFLYRERAFHIVTTHATRRCLVHKSWGMVLI